MAFYAAAVDVDFDVVAVTTTTVVSAAYNVAQSVATVNVLAVAIVGICS